eukprot:7334122-Alexandrium_andersonii.AAC.1
MQLRGDEAQHRAGHPKRCMPPTACFAPMPRAKCGVASGHSCCPLGQHRKVLNGGSSTCLLYTSPSPRD